MKNKGCNEDGYTEKRISYKLDSSLGELLSIEEDWYCWEEKDWMENRLFYENDLEYLEELPRKEKHR